MIIFSVTEIVKTIHEILERNIKVEVFFVVFFVLMKIKILMVVLSFTQSLIRVVQSIKF